MQAVAESFTLDACGADELPHRGWLLSNDEGLLYFDGEGRRRLRVDAAGIEWYDDAGQAIHSLAVQGLASLARPS